MTLREPLSKSVSVQELQYMRNEQGLPNVEIAKRLDISPATVVHYLGPRNPECRSKGRNSRKPLTDDIITRIREMYAEGGSVKGISEKLGVGWATVKKYVSGMEQIHRKRKNTARKPFALDKPVIDNTSELEQEKATENKSMFEIVSQRQTVRLKGCENCYLIETGGGDDTLTIEYDGTEVCVLDASGIDTFIQELQRIRHEYFGDTA